MTMLEYYDSQIPEYYDWMYLDGYSPEQILYAKKRQMMRDFEESQEQAEITNLKIETEVKIK
ncbi:MAG: hypothetical protein SOX32_03670 [Candidatus Choladocola sp.]|nr:hypothetical protein [Candidatus Choladocola sp.]